MYTYIYNIYIHIYTYMHGCIYTHSRILSCIFQGMVLLRKRRAILVFYCLVFYCAILVCSVCLYFILLLLFL